MSKINILSENISNRIAAGEVIERPASVVKELVENSIDSGADKIIVTIEKAGSKLISITDNGSGMDPDDALLCLEPHATSKIYTENDITQILTFGFRGEALPSIASISRFTLRTRPHEDISGTEVTVNGGKFLDSTPVGCAPGTEMIVKDLFFNVPARKKFLKAQATEEKHIHEAMIQLSLPYPTIAFELVMDGRTIFSSPAHSDLKPRIQTFFGKTIANSVLPISYSDSGISVKGFVAQHGITRNSRKEQRVFINGRPIEAPPAYRGIKEGYGGLLEKGRFPPVILFIKMEPSLVDVNVHPAKREVRFRNERVVSQVISKAIRMVLRTSSAPTANVDLQLSLKSILDGASIDYEKANEPVVFDFEKPEETPVLAQPTAKFQKRPFVKRDCQIPLPITDDVKEEGAERESNREIPIDKTPSLPGSGKLNIIGFLDSTYILATAETGILIIDQHAAHERVMYEKIIGAAKGEVLSQKLLFSLTIELSRSETQFIEKNRKFFDMIGFEFEVFSQNTILLNSIPALMSQDNAGGVIIDMLSELLEKGGVSSKLDLERIAKASCTAAVKAHDDLTLYEAKALINQMSECELPFSCPHGRPTIISISMKELEKRFGRR